MTPLSQSWRGFSIKSRIRVRRADRVQATRRLNRRRLASSPTTRNGADSQSALPRVGVGWSRGWPPPAVPEPAGPAPNGQSKPRMQGGWRFEALEVHLVSRWNATANIGQPAAELIPPRIPATTPAFLAREGGRCSSVVRLGTYGSEPSVRLKMPRFSRLDPARSCQVDCRQFASRFSPARATSGHPMIQSQGGALHRSDRPDASPPSVETTFFFDYGPFGPAAIGLNGK